MTECARIAREAEDSLEDYPVLSESDWSEREFNAISSTWERMSVKERLSAIRDSHSDASPFGARRDYPPDDSDGKLSEYMQEYVQSYA